MNLLAIVAAVVGHRDARRAVLRSLAMVARVSKRITVEALDDFDDDERVEIIGGEIVRDATTTFEHSDAQLGMGTEVRTRFGGRGPDGRGW